MPGSLTSGCFWSQWRGKQSRHSWRMRNPRFYVTGKRPMTLSPSEKEPVDIKKNQNKDCGPLSFCLIRTIQYSGPVWWDCWSFSLRNFNDLHTLWAILYLAGCELRGTNYSHGGRHAHEQANGAATLLTTFHLFFFLLDFVLDSLV